MSSGYDDRDDDRYEDDEPREDRPRRRRDVVGIAKERVRGPAIALLITGIISMLASLGGIVNILTIDKQLADVEAQWDNDPNMTDKQRKDMKQMLADAKPALKIGMPVAVVLGITTALITILGSIKMMNLSGSGLAKFGAILSMIPIFSGCCCLGLPFGIWALVTLSKPEVKAGFAAQARAASGMDHEY